MRPLPPPKRIMVVVEQADGQIMKLTTEGTLREVGIKCEPVESESDYPDIGDPAWLYRLPPPVEKWELKIDALLLGSEETGKVFTIETRTTWPT